MSASAPGPAHSSSSSLAASFAPARSQVYTASHTRESHLTFMCTNTFSSPGHARRAGILPYSRYTRPADYRGTILRCFSGAQLVFWERTNELHGLHRPAMLCEQMSHRSRVLTACSTCEVNDYKCQSSQERLSKLRPAHRPRNRLRTKERQQYSVTSFAEGRGRTTVEDVPVKVVLAIQL